VITPPDPPLDDGAVTLRPWHPDDVAALIESIDGDEEITRWMDAIPQPYDEAAALSWIEQATGFWRDGSAAPFAIVEVATGSIVGGVGFHWIAKEVAVGEVGYWLRRTARGRGLTARAVRLVSAWAFVALACARVQLRADEQNVASQRVAEKVGFRREGVLRSVSFNPRLGHRVNFVMFSLLAGELDLPG
jgi:RimJ/RimL family protein N-acetyltransferase